MIWSCAGPKPTTSTAETSRGSQTAARCKARLICLFTPWSSVAEGSPPRRTISSARALRTTSRPAVFALTTVMRCLGQSTPVRLLIRSIVSAQRARPAMRMSIAVVEGIWWIERSFRHALTWASMRLPRKAEAFPRTPEGSECRSERKLWTLSRPLSSTRRRAFSILSSSFRLLASASSLVADATSLARRASFSAMYKAHTAASADAKPETHSPRLPILPRIWATQITAPAVSETARAVAKRTAFKFMRMA